MRSKTVQFAGKDITVREYKIKELKELADKIGTNFDGLIKANDFSDVKNAITEVLEEKLPVIFPGIKKDDIDEAYVSEIEELIQAFVDVNFFGIKKVITPLLKLAQKQ
jgi:hypothetical protein